MNLMAVSLTDPGAVGAIFSLLILLAGSIVVIATLRRTWTSQTIAELKDLSQAQAARIDFLETQLKLMTDQVDLVRRKLTEVEQDSLSLLRRNRELEERQRGRDS